LIYGNKNGGESSDCDAYLEDSNAIFKVNEGYSSGEEGEIPTPDSFYFRLSKNNLYYA